MAERNLAVKLLIDAKDQASSVLAKVGSGFAKLTAGITAAGTAVAAWAGTKLFGDSVRAAEDLERQMGKLNGAIEATGGAAGLTAEEIDAMARRLDEATLGSAAGFRDAATQLLTFKSVGADVFETVLERAQDLADSGFGSLSSNAVMLGKALEDPERGLTALTRAGVTFSEEQRRVIQAMTQAGNAAGAQAVILDAVAGQVGGVARAMGSGLSGAIDLVGKRFVDLKEQLGEAMIPVLTGINQRIADLYARLRDSGAITQLGSAIAEMARQAANAVEDFISRADFSAIVQSIKDFAAGTEERLKAWGENVSAVGEGASRVISGASAVWNTFRQAVELAAAGITAALAGLAGAWAAAVEGANAVGLASEESAAKARLAYESLRDTSAAFRDASVEHWADAKAAAADALGLTATQAQATAEAVQDAATQIGLSADAFEALGEGASYAAEAQAALAQGTERTAQAARSGAQALAGQVQATLELVDATQREYAAAERNLRLAGQEASLRVQRLRNLQAEAEARGEVSNAAEIGIRLAQAEAQGAQAVANATRIRAEAAIAAAEALRAKAQAAGDETAETLAAIQAAEAHAISLGLESRAAEEAARAARALAAAKANASSGSNDLASAADRASASTDRLAQSGGGATSILKWMVGEIDTAIGMLGKYSASAEQAARSILAGWGSFVEKTEKIKAVASSIPLDGFADLRQEIAQLNAGADEATGKIKRLQEYAQFPVTLAWKGFYEGLANIAEAERALAMAAAQQKQMELGSRELAQAINNLGRDFADGTLAVDEYAYKLEGLQTKYRYLGEERLDPLRNALADVRRQMDELRDSAQSTLDGLMDELDRLEDRQEAIQERDYARRKAELEDELAAAREANNLEAITALQKSLAVLDQVHAKRLANLEAERQKEAEITAERAARESASAAAATTGQPSTAPVRTVRVDLNIGGRTTPIRVVEGDEDDLLEAIRRAGLAA